MPTAVDSQTEYKDTLQEFLRAGNLTLIPIWLNKLRSEGKVEDLRKAIEFMTASTGAAAEKKADPNASLPVFNFTFVNGGMQAASVPLVEEVAPAKPQTTVALPATELIQELDVSVSPPPEVTVEQLAELRAELDDMLKEIG